MASGDESGLSFGVPIKYFLSSGISYMILSNLATRPFLFERAHVGMLMKNMVMKNGIVPRKKEIRCIHQNRLR
jgi:hypothetical protein